jgi:hypothetical protein
MVVAGLKSEWRPQPLGSSFILEENRLNFVDDLIGTQLKASGNRRINRLCYQVLEIVEIRSDGKVYEISNSKRWLWWQYFYGIVMHLGFPSSSDQLSSRNLRWSSKSPWITVPVAFHSFIGWGGKRFFIVRLVELGWHSERDLTSSTVPNCTDLILGKLF